MNSFSIANPDLRRQSSPMIDRQYPIGKFHYRGPHTLEQRRDLVARIESLPARLRALLARYPGASLDSPYRPGGWTARQVIHHLSDSHSQSLLRFKYALAVDGSPILPYPEDLWAGLKDYQETPVELSLNLIDALHARWVALLHSMGDADFARAFLHPESGRVTLDRALALYAWHGDHHLEHVRLSLGE